MRKRQLFVNCFPLYLSRRIIAFGLRGSGFVKVLLGIQAYHILASLLLPEFTMEQFIRGCNAQYEDYFVCKNMLYHCFLIYILQKLTVHVTSASYCK